MLLLTSNACTQQKQKKAILAKTWERQDLREKEEEGRKREVGIKYICECAGVYLSM